MDPTHIVVEADMQTIRRGDQYAFLFPGVHSRIPVSEPKNFSDVTRLPEKETI